MDTCSEYGHFTEGSTGWRINCIGPYDSQAELSPYKPYTKEEKDKHRKDRK